MADISIYEGESAFADFNLTYGKRWSEIDKIGQAVTHAQVTKAFYYVKTLLTDADAFLELTDADPAEIEWLADGRIRVKFNDNTEDHAGCDQYFELRLHMANGAWITAKAGTIDILESVVDRPS